MKPYHFLMVLVIIGMVGIVAAEPPKIQMKVNPTTGEAPLTITVSEDSGDATITTWLWNFGNGDSLDKPSGEYTYREVGEFELILTAWNKEDSTTDKVTIVVTAKPTPTPTPTPTVTIAPKPTMNETTTVKVVYEGLTPIKDSLASSSKSSSDAVILKTATEAVMSKVSYPYNITKAETQTTFKIQKYRCDEKTQVCGYWIEAWRDGKEVFTNSPIWISPLPYNALISEVYDEKINELTVTQKEDPKLAVDQILQRYVDMQPLGKAVSYES